MTTDEFKFAMKTFKSLYLNWQFDTENPIMLTAWYQLFKNLTQAEFVDLCVNYSKSNDYPPNSPRQLRMAVADQILKHYDSVDMAMHQLIDFANEFHPAFYEDGVDKMTRALHHESIPLEKAFIAIKEMFVGHQRPWENQILMKKFTETYNEAVKEEVNSLIEEYYSEKDVDLRKAILTYGNPINLLR